MTSPHDTEITAIDGVGTPVGTYSPGVVAGGFLFVSGQGPFDEAGVIVGRTFREQAERTLNNLSHIAENAGTSLDRAVKLGVFISAEGYAEKWATWNDVCRDRFGSAFPARTAVPINLGAVNIEIEVDGVFLLDQEGKEEGKWEK